MKILQMTQVSPKGMSQRDLRSWKPLSIELKDSESIVKVPTDDGTFVYGLDTRGQARRAKLEDYITTHFDEPKTGERLKLRPNLPGKTMDGFVINLLDPDDLEVRKELWKEGPEGMKYRFPDAER